MAKKPPQAPIVPPPVVPPTPTVRSQAEFDALSPEAQASALYQWSNFWLTRSTPSAGAPRSGVRIVIPVPESYGEWQPTEEELASLHSDDWKKF